MSSLTLPHPAGLLRQSDLLLLLVAMVWGTSYGIAKGALTYYPVLGFLAIRFLLTFALLAPTLLNISAPARRDALLAGLPLGGLMLGIFICETFGVAMTQAANAAFLISLCIVMTPFVEWWLLHRRPATPAFVFAGVSLLGALLLGGGLEARFGLGDLLMLGAALLRAITVCLTSKLTQGRQVAPLALTAVQAGIIGCGSLLLAWLSPQGLPAMPVDSGFWLATAYLVLGCTIFAFFAQNWALRHSSPTRVSLLTGSEPVFGALFAVFWLGETLSPIAWLGGALIVLSALWAARHKAI